jgi:hypothetical protein
MAGSAATGVPAGQTSGCTLIEERETGTGDALAEADNRNTAAIEVRNKDINALYLYVIVMFINIKIRHAILQRAPAKAQLTGLKGKMSALSKYRCVGLRRAASLAVNC